MDNEVLKLIVWDIAKSLSMESFESTLGKTPDHVRNFTWPYIGTERWTSSSLEATHNDFVHDRSLKHTKNGKGASCREFINIFQILLKKKLNSFQN